MKKFVIKYEDTSGFTHIEECKTWDEQTAISLLKHPVKEIYRIDSERDNEGGYEPDNGDYYPANHVDPIYDL